MRPLVSYDDLAQAPPTALTNSLPSTSLAALDSRPSTTRVESPPSKKRKRNQANKRNNKKPQRNNSQSQMLDWDDPGSSNTGMDYGAVDDGVRNDNEDAYEEEGGEEEEEEEESRFLTHEEIWDDSALIEAWNAANEEYEEYHGSDKDWKKEKVHKSPLWYNVPPPPSKKAAKPTMFRNPASVPAPAPKNGSTAVAAEAPADSHPVDFDTFVPDHDPSLNVPASASAPPAGVEWPSMPDTSAMYALPDPHGPMPSADEAFQRAMNAMYWSGYWTAVHHYQQRTLPQGHVAKEDVAQDGEEGQNMEVEGNDDESEDLITTQR